MASKALENFLAAQDLDEASAIAPSLTPLKPEDRVYIKAVLSHWENSQAIANLLMYPELIDADKRVVVLLRALEAKEADYYPLAAVVGLQSVAPHRFTDEQRAEVFETLLGYLESESEVIVRRASVTLGQYREAAELDRFSRWLNYPDDVVKQNVLAALLAAEGAEKTKERLTLLLEDGFLSSFNRPFIQTRATQLDRSLREEDQAVADDLIQALQTTQLAYIPNLTEWQAA